MEVWATVGYADYESFKKLNLNFVFNLSYLYKVGEHNHIPTGLTTSIEYRGIDANLVVARCYVI